MADNRLIPNRATALTRLVNKYGTGSTSVDLSSYRPSTVAGIKALDTQRANLGQNPFTALETQLGARATDQGAAVVPEPEAPWYVDAARNVQSIVSEVPKMPVTLAREVMQLPETGAQIPEALSRSSNPAEQLGNLAALPGIRLLPGSFIASQFGTDQPGISGLANNPVFTALDVLPFASKAAKLSNTVKTAERLANDARPVLAQAGLPARTPPIRTFVENWKPGGPTTTTRALGNFEYPVLEANAIGRGMERITEGLKTSSPPGRWAAKTFGREARMGTMAFHRYNADTAAGKFTPDAPVNHELSAMAANLTDEARTLAGEFADLDPVVQNRIAKTIEVGRPGAWEKLASVDPRAMEYATRYKSLNDTWGNALADANEGLTKVDIAGGTEIYDTSSARRIQKARDLEAQQLATANLRAHLDHTTDYQMSPQQILDDARTAMADPKLPMKAKVPLASVYAQALEAAGVLDVSALRKLGGSPSAARLQAAFAKFELPEQVLPVNKPKVTQAALELKTLARTDPTVADLVRSITRKTPDWTRARDMVDLLRKRRTYRVDVDLEDLRFEINRLRASERATGQLDRAGFSDAKLAQAQRVRELTETHVAPARFQPSTLDRLDTTVRNYLADTNTPGPALDALLEKAAFRLYDDPAILDAVPQMKQFKAEARQSWQQLKAEGYDPTFVHHVTEERANSLLSPNVMDYKPSLSQTKARLWAAGPVTQNLAMTLNARGMEYLIQQGSKAYTDWFAKTWAKTADELHQEFYGAAANKIAADPALDFLTTRQKLIEKDWAPFDPESFMNPRHHRSGNPEAQLYAPRIMVENMERLRPKPSEIGKLADPVMKVFRTSLLPLSPRWHIYNIIGGAIMMMGRAENPLTIWRYVNEARKMVKEGGIEGRLSRLDDLTPDELAATRTAVPLANRRAGEFQTDVGGGAMRFKVPETDAGKLQALADHGAGLTLRRLYNSAYDGTRVLRDAFNKGVEKSYSFNEWFDDFYKSMAYLEGFDKSLTKGMSRQQQILKGIEASRQILQNWDTLTPMERTAMRFLMPFYGWTRTLLRYTLQYPADHPWRTSILANMARAEIEDQNTGLPQRLRDLLFIGSPDAEGNQLGINLSGLNPFRDVASYFTLGGFIAGGEGDIGVLTSQLNPAISTMLQWAGVDPSSGSPELYPDMRYDPTTGQLVAAPRENPFIGAIGNFVPQSRVLTQMAGMSQQFKELAARNPQAAGRMLVSSAGFPVLARQVNVPQEVTKAEAVRLKFMKDRLNAGLKSGNLGGFNAMYPTLTGFGEASKAAYEADPKYRPDSSIQGGGQANPWEVITAGLKAVVPGL